MLSIVTIQWKWLPTTDMSSFYLEIHVQEQQLMKLIWMDTLIETMSGSVWFSNKIKMCSCGCNWRYVIIVSGNGQAANALPFYGPLIKANNPRHNVVCLPFACTLFVLFFPHVCQLYDNPDSKVHGANMGPTWVLSAPDGPHVGPMNLALRE